MSKVNGNNPEYTNVYGDFCVGGNGLTARGERLLYTGEDIGDVSAFDYTGSDVSYGSIMSDNTTPASDWYCNFMNQQALNQKPAGNGYAIHLPGADTKTNNSNIDFFNNTSVYSMGPGAGNTENHFKLTLPKEPVVTPSDGATQSGGGKYSYTISSKDGITIKRPDGSRCDVLELQRKDPETFNEYQKAVKNNKTS